ncbi:conserved protein, unknown function [Hepatocystis sp. ex Piliocolobus tephrosceles]|nr:conserved protein, unknown function [Hepatocystis sp. ex Piliocolobus tephrosceles]
MEVKDNMYEYLNNNLSLFELSDEENLKVNIINDNKEYVEYYTQKLNNMPIYTVKYFDIDITDDVSDINDPFFVNLRNTDNYNDDSLQFKINKILSLNNDYSYAKKILSHNMNIIISHEEKNRE